MYANMFEILFWYTWSIMILNSRYFIYPPYVQKGVTFFQGAGSCVERGGTPAIVLWDVMNLSRLAASMPLAMTNMGNALAMALARPGTTWKLVNLAVNQLVSPVQQTWHQNLWTSLNNLFPTLLSEVPASFFWFWRHTVVSPEFSIKLFTCTKARPSWWFGFGMEDLSDNWKIFRKCLDLNLLHHFFWGKQRPSSEDVVKSLHYWKLFFKPRKIPKRYGESGFCWGKEIKHNGLSLFVGLDTGWMILQQQLWWDAETPEVPVPLPEVQEGGREKGSSAILSAKSLTMLEGKTSGFQKGISFSRSRFAGFHVRFLEE